MFYFFIHKQFFQKESNNKDSLNSLYGKRIVSFLTIDLWEKKSILKDIYYFSITISHFNVNFLYKLKFYVPLDKKKYYSNFTY